jgi:hypothetical protein
MGAFGAHALKETLQQRNSLQVCRSHRANASCMRVCNPAAVMEHGHTVPALAQRCSARAACSDEARQSFVPV